MKRTLCTLIVALLLTPLPGGAQTSVLRGVDVYRSTQLSTDDLLQRYAPLLDSIRTAVAEEDMDALGEALGQLARRVKAAGNFAFLDISPIQYFHGDTTVWYLTVDVVDSTDLERLDFDPAPTGQVEGVEDLLSAWRRFESQGFEKMLFWSSDQPCPAFHCLFTFQDTALAPFEPVFRGGVEAHAAELERVLREDADAQDRATAAFLMAHHPDADRVLHALLVCLRDPSSLVRNNAMRVLAFMARDQGIRSIPVKPFIRLVDGPSTTDRNKALVALDGLAMDPDNRPRIRREAGPRLLGLLALKQPNNHDFAYSILKRISGEDFGPHDVSAWRHWLESGALGGLVDPREDPESVARLPVGQRPENDEFQGALDQLQARVSSLGPRGAVATPLNVQGEVPSQLRWRHLAERTRTTSGS